MLGTSATGRNGMEPLTIPEGAKIGARVTFLGLPPSLFRHTEDVMNCVYYENLLIQRVNLFTDHKGVATFNGVPFMTSAGACTSSRANVIICFEFLQRVYKD